MSTNNYTTLSMPAINAYRMDGLGNDFIIVDRRKNSIKLTEEKIIKLSDRKVLGFDQILFIEKLQNNAYPIKIYNSDGGEVSACGNGARCVAYLLGKNLNINEIKLKTSNRLINAKIVGDFDVELEMGKPLFNFEEIPLSKTINPSDITLNIEDKIFSGGFCVNVGNPHIVFFVKDCFEHDLKVIGPKIENHHLFPEKVNVTFAEVIDKNNIKVNVWERGAGLTKACGTAACATAVAALKNKSVNNKVDVKFNEGILKIEIDKNDNIFMTGPVSEIKNIKIEI
jgi:diaminopimelate epimerase